MVNFSPDTALWTPLAKTTSDVEAMRVRVYYKITSKFQMASNAKVLLGTCLPAARPYTYEGTQTEIDAYQWTFAMRGMNIVLN